MSRNMFLRILLLVVAIASSTGPFSSSAELLRLEHPAKPDGSVSLLAVGDWGRNGNYNQSRVAYQASTTSLSRGTSPTFTPRRACRSSVLGNHDYRGNVLAQLDPILRKIDSRWFCMRSFIVDTEIAEFFFVDTTPFVKKYWKIPNKHHYDWRGVEPRQVYISNLLKDLDSALAESTATWRIVVGHHAIRSVSQHGDTKELVQMLLPILETNGVNLYINGHDHCLEHISSTSSPIQFVTSGGGSKAWRGVYRPTEEDKLRFFYDGQGFISLQLAREEAEVAFYDVFGNVGHHWRIHRPTSYFI